MKNIVSIFSTLFILTATCLSQSINELIDCEFFDSEGANTEISNPFGGRVKPNRTDLSGGTSASPDTYFPVLVVFIQFKDEPSDPRGTWLQNSSPSYLSNIIAIQKDTIGNWWEWYNPDTEILSSHWAEVSRGKFHVISPRVSGDGAYSVVLPKTALEYWLASGSSHSIAEQMVQRDIWASIKAQGLTDWRAYDRWKKVGDLFYFTPLGQGDSLIDMIYKVHKSIGKIAYNGDTTSILWNREGYNQLGYYNSTPDIVDSTYMIKINYGGTEKGSGVTISFRAQLPQYVATMGHEHGHQLYSQWHQTYSRVGYGIGGDYFYSPYDMILNEYMQPRNANLNDSNILGDYSSRNSGSGEILKVPVQGNEFFLLASRNKISKWDKVMFGDTAQIDPYGDNTNYGKGLYIYHIKNGIDFAYSDISPQDMECADGFFMWEYAGQSAQQITHDCFISGSTVWPYYVKSDVIYDNDSSNLVNSYGKGDGLDFRNLRNGKLDTKWWGVGKQPTSSCDIGTDRIFTNETQIYTSSEFSGDRWDAWYPGYNEIFSPYSSPSTNTWSTSPSNQNSGIYIWYKSFNSSTKEAKIMVYKAGEGGMTDSSILQITPPSRPMGLEISGTVPPNSNHCHPLLRWKHNLEPDMLRSNNTKKYKIYRATNSSMGLVPHSYGHIATVDVLYNQSPTYFDQGIELYNCTQLEIEEDAAYPVRYYIKSVDKYDTESVPSDFVQEVAIDGGLQEDSDSFEENSNIPKRYSLKQNYPNPYNPSTNIQYDLPRDNFVTIKIYDILGKEVLTLVNELKAAGSYIIGFNGSNISSGIYYYKIKAGTFEQVRKMILLK